MIGNTWRLKLKAAPRSACTWCAAYRRYALVCAEIVGPEPIDLADVVSIVAIKGCRWAVRAAAVVAARRIDDPVRFRCWLWLIQRFAALAPESIGEILARTDMLLTHLNVSRFEAWLLVGRTSFRSTVSTGSRSDC